MRDLTLIHKSEMDLLKIFMKICAEHNLKYTMLGGTMLGAIRHKGFIPWDDDIDIGMFRDDYEKFIEVFNKYYSFEYLNLDEYKQRLNHLRLEDTRMKLLNNCAVTSYEESVFIDIFSLDGMPNNYFSRKYHSIKLLVNRCMMKLSQFEHIGVNIKNRPLHEKIIINIAKMLPFLNKLNTMYFVNNIDCLLKENDCKKSKYIVNFMGAYKFKEMFPSEIYAETEMYRFEDVQLPGPRNYDFYLKQLYGDYMKPPADEDKNKHCTEVIE